MQRHENGLTLLELMIAVTLGLLLIAGSLASYLQARSGLEDSRKLAELQERLEYALAALEEDVLLAGFWGLHANAGLLIPEPAVSARCRDRDVSSWVLQVAGSVDVVNPGLLPCPTHGETMADTDALIVRHASAASAEPRAGSIQVQTNHQTGRIFVDGNVDTDLPESRVYNLRVHAWYIDTQSSETGLPALRRQTLVHGQRVENQEIMPGIENLKISLEFDRDGDGWPDSFSNNPQATDDYTAEQIIAVHVKLTARAPRWSGFIQRLQKAPDNYQRITATRTIRLRNQSAG